MDHVLFLDDDHARHSVFHRRVTARGHFGDRRLLYVFSAAEAIEALRAHEGAISEAFLDHDLCVEDHCVLPGQPSKQPTGMVVVDYIVAMRRPPAAITVHSYNHHAAVEMCARLSRIPNLTVHRVLFEELFERYG